MRTLNRPMFNMGGPIKEGVMHGIREPYKGGGRTLAGGNQIGMPMGNRTGFADPVRKNIAKRGLGWLSTKIPGFSKGWAQRAWNKFRPTFTQQPGVVTGGQAGTTGKYISQTMPPVSKLSRIKAFAKENPWWTYGGIPYAATTDPGLAFLKGAPKVVGGGLKWGAEVLAPGWAEPYLPWEVPGVKSAYQPPWADSTQTTELVEDNVITKDTGSDYGQFDRAQKRIAEGKATELAKKRKDDRINNLLEIMGYDQSKKDAAYNALLDASQIISQAPGGKSLDISTDIIQPVIAATSKRFDKPQEIEEAVRLMRTKAEIEKEMDPYGAQLKQWQIEGYKKQLAGANFKEALLAVKGGPPSGSTLASLARQYLPGDFKVMDIKVPKKTDTLEHIIDVVKASHTEAKTNPDKKPFPPGQYVLKDRVVSIDHLGNVTPLDI